MNAVVQDGSAGLEIIIDGELGLTHAGSAECGIVTRVHDPQPTYQGETDITPGTEAVTLNTHGKLMTEDIVIEPIPENYGLITWNGSTLTVS